MGQISDLFNYEFTAKNIEEIVTDSYAMGRTKWGWRQTMLWVKCVCRRWNKNNPSNKVIYYAIDLLSNNFKDALQKSYTVTVTYRWNEKYDKDFMTDGMLNWTSFWNPSYGHCVAGTGRMELGIPNKTHVKDNYKWRSYYGKDRNYYEIKDLKWLVSNSVFYPTGYIIIPEAKTQQTLENLKNLQEQKILLEYIIEKNSALWYKYPATQPTRKAKIHENNDRYRMLLTEINIEMNKL